MFRRLLSAPVARAPITSLDAWWAIARPLGQATTEPIELAITAGFAMDRVAYAFASGYQAALRALCPALSNGLSAAFCATEDGGAKPDQIATSLTADGDRFVLSGTKTFVTLGAFAERLLIVARSGPRPDGRAELRVVIVPNDRRGVSLAPGIETPFAPEIGHARLTLEDVVVHAHEVLPGDGYEAYLKPFRTIEDIFVHAAALAYLVGLARRHGHDARVPEMLSLLFVLRCLAKQPPLDPVTHVALAGVITQTAHVIDQLTTALADRPSEEGERLLRDRPLFRVASRVRDMRLASAQRALASRG